MKIRPGQSLTLRLTLLFALASACVLFLLGLLIGNSVERHFEEQDIGMLAGKIELIRHVFERDAESESRATLVHRLDDVLTGHHDLRVTVLGPAGQTLYTNADLTFPAVLLARRSGKGVGRPVTWTDDTGQPWRGISAMLHAGPAGQKPYLIAIATEISHHEHFMSAFRGNLWIFIALATLAMGLLGWAGVRHGLLPLQTIKRQAGEITARHLHTRLPTAAIPRELGDLTCSLNEMLSRLEESFQRLSDFSSDLAHELRTPVCNLLTQTQVTLSKERSADEYRDILSSNAEELERLSRMITDMLFLAKADHQQFIPNRERVELADEVADLLDFYSLLAEEKNIKLSLTGAGVVSGDRLMLRRAFSNLLSNALRHTPNEGYVTVSIVKQAAGVVLSVENSGDSIPAEHLPRLFDRFYRADASRQRTTEGSGLGLAITRSILLAHGGDVSVASADGVTRFTLTLPADFQAA